LNLSFSHDFLGKNVFKSYPLHNFVTTHTSPQKILLSEIASTHKYIQVGRYSGPEKPIMNGTVKSWKMSYGFIEAEGINKDVFVHESDVQSGSHLIEGTKVKFDLIEEARGPKAVHVEIVE
jgi:cold shock CspA family protein